MGIALQPLTSVKSNSLTLLNNATKIENIEEIQGEILEENLSLLNSFLVNMKSSGKSEHTIKSYSFQIREFLEFIGSKKFIDIDFADCEDYQTYLTHKGNSACTIIHKRAALSTFTKYVKRRYGKSIYLDNQFIIMDTLPKERVKPLVIWNKDKVVRAIKHFEEKDIRLAAMLALALYSGRRRSELPRFKVSDFTDDRLIANGKFWVSSQIETKGRGKHEMNCFVMTEFKPYLDKWLETRPYDSEWLFPDERNTNEHINDYVMGWFAEQIKAVPEFNDFHWHMVRHTMVTTMLDDGVDANIVVKFIGWADAKMLSVYDDRSRESVIDKYFSEMVV